VTKNGVCALLRLGSMFVTVFSEAARQKLKVFAIFQKFYFQPPVSNFVFLNVYFVIAGLI